jgi:hypothetical protein
MNLRAAPRQLVRDCAAGDPCADDDHLHNVILFNVRA